MIDPTISAAATASLETAINHALRYDPATKLKLSRLAGKSLAIEVSQSALRLCVHFDEYGVRISQTCDNPTTRLVGSVRGLLSLAVGDRVNLAGSGVEAWGNSALLADVKHIASDLDLDWEEALNDVLGDLFGHPIAEIIRLKLGWVKARSSAGKRLLHEFLTEEFRAVPSEVELSQFNQAVDELRLAADRAEARLRRLTQRLNTPVTDANTR